MTWRRLRSGITSLHPVITGALSGVLLHLGQMTGIELTGAGGVTDIGNTNYHHLSGEGH